MSITITKEADDLFVVTIQGLFTYDDQKQIESSASDSTGPRQRGNVLVLAEGFSGWGKEGDWGDLTFMYENDPYIDKIAIVADEKWKDQILMFAGAGRRQAAVEFFFPDEIEDARNWIAGESD